jgi:uncharacterized protein DUF3857/transglutaminase superfamily protein
MIPRTSSHYTSRSVLFLVILALLIAPLGTIRSSAAGEDWRAVDAADLALKAAVVEPNADSEAIFWDIRVDDGGENDLVLSHYVRIKIFNERGREKYSKIDIPYINGVKIKDIAARTIKSDGSIVELAKNDIIEKTVVKANGLKLRTKTFAFPGIEPGAIIEYKWKEVRSNSSAQNLRLQFQRDIPVQAVTYHLKPAGSSIVDVRAFNMDKPQFQKEKNGFQVATVKNMPAFREEPLMPPEDSVKSWAMVRYLNIFTLLLGYNMLGVQVYIAFQPYLKIDKEVKQKVAELTANVDDADAQIEKIFQFCRNNIKNTSDKTQGFTEDDIEKLKENKKPSDTLKRGVGPAIDVNLLFAAMVNAAGFDARIALMPNRGERLFDPNVVVPGALRPSAVAVRFGTKWKFFNPGLPYVAPGMLRWQEEGVDALVVDKDQVWVKTPVTDAQKSKEKRTATLRLDENGTLEGDVSIEYSGHLAVERKVANEDDSPAQREENLKEMVKDRLSSAELTNIVIENDADASKPFVYKFHVRVPEYAQKTGKRLFFQPGFFTKGVSALFSASTRTYPIYFHYPWSEEDQVTLELPKGFALDNADRPAPINAGAVSQYDVQMGITNDQRTLIYKRKFFFGNPDLLLFSVDKYEAIKQLFDEVSKADNHIITLKQAASTN